MTTGVLRFLDTIAEHGPFLLFVLPVIGCGLVWASAPLGSEVVRRTALTNVVLSLLLSGWMLVCFQPESQGMQSVGVRGFQFQMTGQAAVELELDGIPPPGDDKAPRNLPSQQTSTDADATRTSRDATRGVALLRVAVGVDGLSVWFPGLLALLMLPVVHQAGRARKPASRLCLLLLLQAAFVGVFAAIDFVMFVLCLEAATILLFVLGGRYGSPTERTEMVPLIVGQFAGSLLIFFALSSAAVAHQWLTADNALESRRLTFSFIQLTAELPYRPDGETAGNIPPVEFWSTVEPLIYGTLVLGLLIKSAVVPFHGRLGSAGRLWPVWVAVPAYAVLPCVGVYGYLRLAASMCPQSAAGFGPWLTTLLLVGSGFCVLIALVQNNLRNVLAYASAAHIGIAFAAAAGGHPAGTTAAVLHLITHMAGFALLVLTGDRAERELSDAEATDIPDDVPEDRGRPEVGNSPAGPGRWGTFSHVYLIAVFAVIGIPGLCGFPALWLTLLGFLQGSSTAYAVTAAGSTVAVFVLLASALLRPHGPAQSHRGASAQSRRAAPAQSRRAASRRTPSLGAAARIADPSGVSAGQSAPATGRFDAADRNELLVTLPLAVVMLAVGVVPQFVVQRTQDALQHLPLCKADELRLGGHRPQSRRTASAQSRRAASAQSRRAASAQSRRAASAQSRRAASRRTPSRDVPAWRTLPLPVANNGRE